jgi:hypothetical protein
MEKVPSCFTSAKFDLELVLSSFNSRNKVKGDLKTQVTSRLLYTFFLHKNLSLNTELKRVGKYAIL